MEIGISRPPVHYPSGNFVVRADQAGDNPLTVVDDFGWNAAAHLAAADKARVVLATVIEARRNRRIDE